MVMFILGAFAGGIVGVLFMAFCNAKSNADDKMEELIKENKNSGNKQKKIVNVFVSMGILWAKSEKIIQSNIHKGGCIYELHMVSFV